MAARMFPSDGDLVAEMAVQNPWWAGGGVPRARLQEFKRPDYFELARHLDDHPVHGLLGARQVGKTTVLYQLAAELVSRQRDPRRVMFATLDEAGLFPSADNLRRMLGLYGIEVLGEPLHAVKRRTYIILDEVQAVKNWQQPIKNVVDRRGPITFVVSGSSSADIFGSSESLIGRIRHQTMLPMGFSECASFRSPGIGEPLARAGAGMREAFARSAEDGTGRAFYDKAAEALLDLAPIRSELLARLSEYLVYGGCPGVATAGDPGYKAAELKTHIRLSMYNDIVKVGDVRNPDVIEQLFYMLAQRSPRLVNKDKAARNLGVNKHTLDAYMHLLKATYMVSYARPYAPRQSVRSRAEKKAYINDVGVRNAALSMHGARALADSAEVGMMAETVAGDHARRLLASLDPASMAEMPCYWRSSRGDEVDIVMDLYRRPVPIEVKYRHRVAAGDLRGLSRFADRFGPGLALALTKDDLWLVDDSTVAMPLWLYLVMC